MRYHGAAEHLGRAAGHLDYRLTITRLSLMMVNYGNSYIGLENLIRHLHDEAIRDNVSPNDVERFLLQMELLTAVAKAAQSGGILYAGLAP